MKSFTQEDIAEKISVSRQTIAKLKAVKSLPDSGKSVYKMII